MFCPGRISLVMAGLVPRGASLSRDRQSLGCHAPLQAGYPVIPARADRGKARAKSDLPCLLDRPPTRTMTTESMMVRLKLAPMGLDPRIHLAGSSPAMTTEREPL